MDENEILDDFSHESDSDNLGNLIKVDLISTNKFIILFIFSLGLYGLWWMYKAWKFFKEKDLMDIMPAARAIFSIFFAYGLFDQILAYAKENKVDKDYSSGLLFVCFIGLNLSARLPDPFSLISILGFLPLMLPHQTLNLAIENSPDYHGVEANGFNGKQIAILIIGTLFWILILIGTFMDVENF